jgi:hypothetical protein
MHLQPPPEPDDVPLEDYYALPGLFRAWELGQVVEPGHDYLVEDAGCTATGEPLVRVLRREPSDPGGTP